jgi:hypothetical protein
MSIRERINRWFSPSLFALAALCFLLPFATVSCDDASTAFTGVQLVTHTVPRGGVLDEGPDCSRDISVCVERSASNTATVALAAALLGLALGAIGFVRGPGWFAAVGVAALVRLQFAGGFLGPDIYFHAGYQLTLLLFTYAGGLHLRRAWRRVHPRRLPRGARAIHIDALLAHILIACLIGGAAGAYVPAVSRAVGAWFLLVVVPTWLVVAVLLCCWRKSGREALARRAERFDSLLWLGPLLPLALCSRSLRTFVLARQVGGAGVAVA